MIEPSQAEEVSKMVWAIVLVASTAIIGCGIVLANHSAGLRKVRVDGRNQPPPFVTSDQLGIIALGVLLAGFGGVVVSLLALFFVLFLDR
jgi:hypothetical protein